MSSPVSEPQDAQTPAGTPPAADPAADDRKVVPLPSSHERTAEAGPPLGKVGKVCDVQIGWVDGSGRRIDDVYFKRSSYAIYRSGDKVLVQYDTKAQDDTDETEARATAQIAQVAPLIPLRNRLQFLLLSEPGLNARYYPQIAEAFRLALEGKAEIGVAILKEAIQEVLDTRAANGRLVYLKVAAPLTLKVTAALVALSVPLLYVGGSDFLKAMSPLAHLAIATASGAIGALLSISIGLRTRSVATDGDTDSNRMDACVRILIGVISAGVLYLILSSGALKGVQIGDMNLAAGSITWQLALLVGFAAGFLERLVPDLLEKKTDSAKPAAPDAGRA